MYITVPNIVCLPLQYLMSIAIDEFPKNVNKQFILKQGFADCGLFLFSRGKNCFHIFQALLKKNK